MKQPKDKIRLKHMIDAARKAVDLVDQKSRNQFDEDEALGFAVVRLLEVIGEAARSISEETKGENPHIPWKEMIGTRNHLIHGYFDVDYDIVWKIVKNELPDLVKKLEGIQ